MARQAGQTVTSFEVRRQFVNGNTVCSIVDWEMAMPGLGRMTAAELLEVEDGVIVRRRADLRRGGAASGHGDRMRNDGRLT